MARKRFADEAILDMLRQIELVPTFGHATGPSPSGPTSEYGPEI